MGLDRRKLEKLNLDNRYEWESKTITSALKTYLRTLSEPLMTFRYYDSFIAAASKLPFIKMQILICSQYFVIQMITLFLQNKNQRSYASTTYTFSCIGFLSQTAMCSYCSLNIFTSNYPVHLLKRSLQFESCMNHISFSINFFIH